eukprot:COSAG01_NODE_36919_length_510_cov_43.873479_1_plen_89_part_01
MISKPNQQQWTGASAGGLVQPAPQPSGRRRRQHSPTGIRGTGFRAVDEGVVRAEAVSQDVVMAEEAQLVGSGSKPRSCLVKLGRTLLLT